MSKKKEKTVEELLQEALVPEEEQPYELPDNWVWVRTGTLNNIVTGSTPCKKNEDYYGGSIPFFKPADLKGKIVEVSEYVNEEGLKVSREVPANSTLVCCIGSIGKVGYTHVSGITNQQINALIPNQNSLDSLYTYYYCQSDYFNRELWNRSSSTTISIINKSRMSEIPFPLAPKEEQKRIADKVEGLLNKINQAKQLIEEAKETFELRRAAILDKAFRGELTANWRMENSCVLSAEELLIEISEKKKSKKRKETDCNFNYQIDGSDLPKGWVYCRLGDVIESFKYGTSSKSDYTNNGTPVLRIPNVDDFEFNLNDMKYSEGVITSESHLVSNGDILIIRSNGSKDLVGKCAVVTKNCDGFAYASYLIRIRPLGVVPEFVLMLLKSQRVRNQLFKKSKSSAGINNINIEELSSIVIPLAPLEEQKEIVKVVRNLLDKEDVLLESLSINENLEILISSVLSKAFRGELGTNNPEEECVQNLLVSL